MKCLITKLNGVVNSNSFLKIGELRMQVEKKSDNLSFIINCSKETIIKIIGNGYFDNNPQIKEKTLKASSSNNIIISKGTYTISISDKYHIKTLQVISSGQGDNVILDLADLKYSKEIKDLGNNTLGLYGDLSNLTGISLNNFSINNSSVTGNFDGIDLSKLVHIQTYNTDTAINLQLLSGNVNLTTFSVNNAYGNIASLKDANNMRQIKFFHSKLTGDLALLSSNCAFVSLLEDKGSTFTWSNRPTSANILALEGGVKVDNVDKVLNNLMNCQVGYTSSDPNYYKVISLKGTRTSESDAAVQALQSKGYTVSITPA